MEKLTVQTASTLQVSRLCCFLCRQNVLVKNRLNLCVDWQKIDKKDYLRAMEQSPYNAAMIHELIRKAVTNHINDREIFMKGIDYSYYYETIED